MGGMQVRGLDRCSQRDALDRDRGDVAGTGTAAARAVVGLVAIGVIASIRVIAPMNMLGMFSMPPDMIDVGGIDAWHRSLAHVEQSQQHRDEDMEGRASHCG